MTVNAKDLDFGSIVCASVSDEKGKNWKHRSLVVLTPKREISQASKIVLACITGTFPEKAEPDFVEVPWHPQGHPATGLTKRSAACCRWLRELDAFDIESIEGFLGPAHMDQIVARVRHLNPRTLGDGRPIRPGTVPTPGQRRDD